MANHENRFSARPEPARHETVEGILSPEGLCLLWSLGLPATAPELPPSRGATTPMHLQKCWRDGARKDAASSPEKNRDEHNMGGSRI